MNSINITSPSFGSIQTRYTRMSLEQKSASDKFSENLKNNPKYKGMEQYGDIDVYILPAEKKTEVQVRLMDPYSGNFIKGKNGKIICYTVSSSDYKDKMKKISRRVAKAMGKVIKGKLPRPNANPESIQKGTTAMAKIRPDKYKSFDKDVQEFQKAGLKLKDALNLALSSFMAIYHTDNEDAKF